MLVLERLPAGVGLVIAVKNDDGAISPPQFLALPTTDQRITTTLVLPQSMPFAERVPTPFGLVGGEDLTGKDTGGNSLSSRLFDAASWTGSSPLLDASALLTIGERTIYDDLYQIGQIPHWIEGEAVLFPSESAASLLLSRRFINMPGTNEGVLSIDQVTNPYPVPIEVEIGIDLSDLGVNKLKYNQSGAVILLDFGRPGGQDIPHYVVFGSSVVSNLQRIVIPAASCRSAVHLWDSLPDEANEDAVLSKGIDLINRFKALDFKAIILEEKACPLAE